MKPTKCKDFEHTEVDFTGPMAGEGYVSGNAAVIDVGLHYSGSGPDSFGGALDWPHVRVNVGFPTSTPIDRVQAIAEEFSLILEKHGYTR